MDRALKFLAVFVVALVIANVLARRFMITTDDEDALRRSFTPAVLAACEALLTTKQWQMSAGGEWLFVTFGLAQADDLGVLLDGSAGVATTLRASCGAAAASAP